MYSGVGATFVPNGTSKTIFNLSTFDGIQFDIKNVSGTQPLYLEMLTQETQPTTLGGSLAANANPTVAINNNRGYYLTGSGGTVTNTSTALPATMSTVYVPFSLLIPRHLPTLSTCGTDNCQAPVFNPLHGLGFQFSAYPDMNNVGGTFELDIDNVSLYTGDNGLNPAGATTAVPRRSTTARRDSPRGRAAFRLSTTDRRPPPANTSSGRTRIGSNASSPAGRSSAPRTAMTPFRRASATACSSRSTSTTRRRSTRSGATRKRSRAAQAL